MLCDRIVAQSAEKIVVLRREAEDKGTLHTVADPWLLPLPGTADNLTPDSGQLGLEAENNTTCLIVNCLTWA